MTETSNAAFAAAVVDPEAGLAVVADVQHKQRAL